MLQGFNEDTAKLIEMLKSSKADPQMGPFYEDADMSQALSAPDLTAGMGGSECERGSAEERAGCLDDTLGSGETGTLSRKSAGPKESGLAGGIVSHRYPPESESKPGEHKWYECAYCGP
jgi:hypothetical protein